MRKFNEALYEARPIVEDAVNKVLKGRKKERYEYSGAFTANVAFCNLYVARAVSRLTGGMLMARHVWAIMLIN